MNFNKVILICCVYGVISGYSLYPMRVFAHEEATFAQARTEENGTTNPNPARMPTRPLLQPQQYIELAAFLRDTYSQEKEKWPKPFLDEGVPHEELSLVHEVLPRSADRPPDTKEQRDLGKLLFFDPRLSRSGEMSCATCHNPDLAWADGLTVAVGRHRRLLKRNTPSIMNNAFHSHFFWDGRASSFEQQAEQAITNPDEMNSDPELVTRRLNRVPRYRELFNKAYGSEDIKIKDVLHALAAFQRTLISSNASAFDRFLQGQRDALGDAAVRGLHLFRTTARCMNCHSGPLLTDNKFHDLGLSFFGREREDLGRYKITGNPEDSGKFKTPGLRNVSRTAPYMHNGILLTLDDVLRLYNAGMPTLRPTNEQSNDPLFPKKSHHLRPLGLNQRDLDDLKAFLESLEEPRRRISPGLFPAITDGELADEE